MTTTKKTNKVAENQVNNQKASAKKVQRIIEHEAFVSVFSGLKIESVSLNAVLRNLQARAAVDEATATVCGWLNLPIVTNAKEFAEARKQIIEKVVYYTAEEGTPLQPVRLTKVATLKSVDGKDKDYFGVKPISWTEALKMICNRSNKGLEAMHTQVEESAYYSVDNGAFIEVTNKAKTNEIAKAIESKENEAKAKASVNKQLRELTAEQKAEILEKYKK